MEELLGIGARMAQSANGTQIGPDGLPVPRGQNPFDVYGNNDPGGIPGGAYGYDGRNSQNSKSNNSDKNPNSKGMTSVNDGSGVPYDPRSDPLPQSFGDLDRKDLEKLMAGRTPEQMSQLHTNEQEMNKFLMDYQALLEAKQGQKGTNVNGIGGIPEHLFGYIDKEGATYVKPVPGFVIKTQFLQGEHVGKKLFLNVCGHELVEKPHVQRIVQEETEEEKRRRKIKEQAEENVKNKSKGGKKNKSKKQESSSTSTEPQRSEEVQEGIRIPVSIGRPCTEGPFTLDKKGEACVIVDVLANADIVKEADNDFDTKMMVVEVSLNAVAQKFSWVVSREPKFPKMKAKGLKGTEEIIKSTNNGMPGIETQPFPRPQRIRVTNRSQITEVDSETGEVKGNLGMSGSNGSSAENPLGGLLSGHMPSDDSNQNGTNIKSQNLNQQYSNSDGKNTTSNYPTTTDEQIKPDFEIWYYKPEVYVRMLEKRVQEDKEKAEQCIRDVDMILEEEKKFEKGLMKKKVNKSQSDSDDLVLDDDDVNIADSELVETVEYKPNTDLDLDDIDVSDDEENEEQGQNKKDTDTKESTTLSCHDAGGSGNNKSDSKTDESELKSVSDPHDPSLPSNQPINGFELDCYKSGQELIRNLRQKGWVNSDSKIADSKETYDKLTKEEQKQLVKDRIFVCRIHLSHQKFSTQLKIGKQVQIAISDEAIKINFPTQYQGYGGKYTLSPYSGLQIWFPREFCSANGMAYWDVQQKVLEIAIPTDSTGDKGFEDELDDELLNEIF